MRSVIRKGGLLTDFIYEECGVSSEGVAAAKKDGKWGVIRLKEKEDNERTDSDNHRYKR